MELLNIDRTLSVMVTYKCNAACFNCGTLSNPKVKGRLDFDKIASAIHQAKSLNFANVVFTGGEATLYLEDVKKGIVEASGLGLPTRLVTNGIWGLNLEKAHRVAKELHECGLDEINFSTGNEHVKFVPIEAVLNSLDASRRHGLDCYLMIEKTSDDFPQKDVIMEYIEADDDQSFCKSRIIESPWMPLDPNVVQEYAEGDTATKENLARFKGCDSILQTYVLSTDRDIKSCCGLGARNITELHSLEDFDENDANSLAKIIYEAEQDFLKIWMRNEGPEKILNWVSEIDPSVQWEGKYAHRCQACLRIYSDPTVKAIIRRHYLERLPDVVARELIVGSLHEFY